MSHDLHSSMTYNSEAVSKAAAAVRKKLGAELTGPVVGCVLGSGLGFVGENLLSEHDALAIPYHEIPSFPTSSVTGHKGQLVIGKKNGVNWVIMQGRVHYYEGYPAAAVAFPIRVLIALGVEKLVLTNSSGGFGDGFKAGDLMIIEDHLNLTGNHPLVGPNDDRFGSRFPDMTDAYSSELRTLAEGAARKLEIPIKKGVYVGVSGPTYETPAEIRMFKLLGGSAVGMSTVYETIAAAHHQIPCLGLSCITNLASGISPHKLTHEEVKENAALSAERFGKLLYEVVDSIATLRP